MFAGRQNARRRGEFRAGDFASYSAWRDLHAWIVTDPLGFSQVAGRHHVQFVRVLAEPDRRWNSHSGFPVGGQQDIFLTVD